MNQKDFKVLLSLAFIRFLGNKSQDILGGFQKPIKRNRHLFTILGSLSTCDFDTRTASGSELFPYNSSSYNHIYIAKYLFYIRDD